VKKQRESGNWQSGEFHKKTLEQAQKNKNIFVSGGVLFLKALKPSNITESILAILKQNK
jgi:hypothetical protein